MMVVFSADANGPVILSTVYSSVRCVVVSMSNVEIKRPQLLFVRRSLLSVHATFCMTIHRVV